MSQQDPFPVAGATSVAPLLRHVADHGPVLELVVLPFWAVLLFGLLTPKSMASSGDPSVFFDRAVSVLKGLVPFRDFSSEYPPLSLVPMTLPHLWPDVDHSGYFTLLNLENGVLASALAITLLWLARRSWSWSGVTRTLAMWALLILVLAPIATWRFDLMAVVLMMLGVIAAAKERPGLAGLLLGLATLTKIFPLVVVPVLALRCLANGDVRGAMRSKLALPSGLSKADLRPSACRASPSGKVAGSSLNLGRCRITSRPASCAQSVSFCAVNLFSRVARPSGSSGTKSTSCSVPVWYGTVTTR